MRIEQEKKAYPDPEPSQLFEKNLNRLCENGRAPNPEGWQSVGA
jgi:hypothetical protein